MEGRLEYLKTLAAIILNELGTLEQPENIGRQLTLKDEVSRLETELIRNVLTFTRGSQRRAARVLGLNATTLHTKIRRLRIDLKADVADDCEAVNTFPESAPIESGSSFVESMSKFEIQLIENALEHVAGNQTKAARLLGIPLTTLNCKIRKYEIDPSRFAVRPPLPPVRFPDL